MSSFGLQGEVSNKPSSGGNKGENTIVIAAALIAGLKLVHEENLESPKAKLAINSAVALAHKIYWRTRDLFPTLF